LFSARALFPVSAFGFESRGADGFGEDVRQPRLRGRAAFQIFDGPDARGGRVAVRGRHHSHSTLP